jgi:FMN reductase
MRDSNGRIRVVGLGGTLREDSASLRALELALEAAERSGAEVELLDLRELDLPMYEPGKPLAAYGAGAARLVEAMRGADAMIWSTAAYHGTIAGVTKNALDFAQFLSRDEKPYLQDRVVGLIATAGGGMAGPHAIDAMVHTVHALRGTAAPLSVPIPRARGVFEAGEVRNATVEQRLRRLGDVVTGMAARLRVPEKPVEPHGRRALSGAA